MARSSRRGLCDCRHLVRDPTLDRHVACPAGTGCCSCNSLLALRDLRATLDERLRRAAVVASNEGRHVFFEGRAWLFLIVDTLHGGAGEEVKGRR